MRGLLPTGALLLAMAPFAGVQAIAQTNSGSTPTAPASKRFPYPGDAPPATPATPAPSSPSATAPQARAPQDSQPASKRFPYPGETEAPDAPVPGTTSPGAGQSNDSAGDNTDRSPIKDAGSSGSSSSAPSSSSSSSSSTDDATDRKSNGEAPAATDPDANDPAAVPRSERHKPPPGPRQTPPQREAEDLQVASFYFDKGNFQGSYDRARDAVSLDSEDARAQLALGQAARKLGRLDEAERAYKRCLDLDPVPKVRKPAEKALREMTGG